MASFWRICVAIMATFFVIQLFIRALLRAPYLKPGERERQASTERPPPGQEFRCSTRLRRERRAPFRDWSPALGILCLGLAWCDAGSSNDRGFNRRKSGPRCADSKATVWGPREAGSGFWHKYRFATI